MLTYVCVCGGGSHSTPSLPPHVIPSAFSSNPSLPIDNLVEYLLSPRCCLHLSPCLPPSQEESTSYLTQLSSLQEPGSDVPPTLAQA